jgi:hypothetical protein
MAFTEYQHAGWLYGTGEYGKKLGDLAGTSGISSSFVQSLLNRLSGAVGATVPVSYIYAKKPATGHKFIGGEWTLAHGGVNARNAAFTKFASQFRKAPTDRERVALIKATRTWPGTPSVNKAISTYEKEVRTDIKEDARGKVAEEMGKLVPLVIGGFVVLYFLLKKR